MTQPKPIPAKMNKRINRGSTLLSGVSLLTLLFFTLPPLALILRAIETSDAITPPDTSLITSALVISIGTSLITMLVIIIFMTPFAYVMEYRKFPGKRLVSVFTELPIVMPPAVAGLALLLTFGREGLLGGLFNSLGIELAFTTAAVVIAQVFVAAPFYIRAARLGLQDIPYELEDSARVDGAEGWSLFRQIQFPLARQAMLAGAMQSWARAMGEFGATILFAGSLRGRTQTMSLLVYDAFEQDFDAAIWAGLILLLVAFIALLLAQQITTQARNPHPTIS